ncbi:MAG TPA: hypothetical protein VLW51_01150 [Solirubrobacteraceae bacterium]|jgi:hypothetical protein|nr:hypothetical protein [Solirubrobacteraceae bacterium]
MTGKSDFTEQEWDTVLKGPPAAGMIVATAAKGGTFKESFAIANSYAEARRQHGASELLDAIVSAKPEVEHHLYHSYEEMKTAGLELVRNAVGVLATKATPEEVNDYRRFVLTLSDHVANAHREDGVAVSGGEQAAIADITAALGGEGEAEAEGQGQGQGE